MILSNYQGPAHRNHEKYGFDWVGRGFSPGNEKGLKMFFGSAARSARR
jgi:hypothetical protein